MLILQKIFFVPNDFADENAMSLDFSGDDEEFDKALYNFYLNNKVKYLKRKLSSSCRRNVMRKSLLICSCEWLREKMVQNLLLHRTWPSPCSPLFFSPPF
ncbi:uncharacterized protein LOC119318185 isoform X2 [Triticum dicoccoides]|uniref:uncharacterized protein LOC119318185 isoform X2 n=1 Tax=Triticum dicoccoides TaxID=85692 RepID=UPI001890E395|nr:uncharacterized protein LOC119318185 isoform X2 [Triticum dicoccoides]